MIKGYAGCIQLFGLTAETEIRTNICTVFFLLDTGAFSGLWTVPKQLQVPFFCMVVCQISLLYLRYRYISSMKILWETPFIFQRWSQSSLWLKDYSFLVCFFLTLLFCPFYWWFSLTSVWDLSWSKCKVNLSFNHHYLTFPKVIQLEDHLC